MDGTVAAVAVPTVAAGVAAALTAVVATTVATAARASAGAAALREEPLAGPAMWVEWAGAVSEGVAGGVIVCVV